MFTVYRLDFSPIVLIFYIVFLRISARKFDTCVYIYISHLVFIFATNVKRIDCHGDRRVLDEKAITFNNLVVSKLKHVAY